MRVQTHTAVVCEAYEGWRVVLRVRTIRTKRNAGIDVSLRFVINYLRSSYSATPPIRRTIRYVHTSASLCRSCKVFLDKTHRYRVPGTSLYSRSLRTIGRSGRSVNSKNCRRKSVSETCDRCGTSGAEFLDNRKRYQRYWKRAPHTRPGALLRF